MIVKCEQCQTRFKIPDDKVTDKGVKVRCTKCSHTFRVTRDMAQPATATVPALQPGGGADPFARFGAVPDPPSAEVTRPGVFALGVEASRSPELGRGAPAYPNTKPNQAVAHTSSSPFDFASLRPPMPTAPTVPAVPAFVPQQQQQPSSSAPFDFAAIAPPTPGGNSPSAAFDFSGFAAPQASAPPPPPPPSAPTALTQPNMAALPAFDFGPPMAAPAGMPPPPPFAGDFGPPARPQSSAPVDDGAATQQGLPSLPGSGAGADGFFASTESSQTALPSMDDATARSMFDLPQAPAQQTLPDVLPPPDPEDYDPPAGGAVAPVAVARMSAPREAAVPMDEPPRRRGVFGIIVNIMIAAMLVVALAVVGSAFLNEGKVSADSLSIESLKNTFAPSVEFVASDVSNGLYETRAGRSVFFVRGEIINRSAGTVKVVVKAEIVEDGKVVRAGESWASDPSSAEEIFQIDGTEALEALNRRVEKRAVPVPPESTASFVVPFTEFPPDLKGFRVRVSARAVPVNPTAAATP